MSNAFDDGKGSTFGRELMSYISSKLPYSGIDINDIAGKLNPKYKYFEDTGTKRAEVLSRHSVSQNFDYNNSGLGSITSHKKYGEIMYANVQKDKFARIRDYRMMAAFSEVANALDEICDDVINIDSSSQSCVKLKTKNIELSEIQQETLKREFAKFSSHFDFEHKGWSYFRQLLVEGEIYWEHIIHEKYPEEGILGVVQVPTELIDPVFSNVQNVLVKGYLYRKPVFDPKNPMKQTGVELIPMDKNQITYVHSDVWNETKTMRLPFLENARRAYRQLSMVEDAIIIYRMSRAPERLVFNVDVGNMPAPKAEAYLTKLKNQFWGSKTYDPSQGGIVNKFNPQSILDNFWFAKRAGSEGTNVDRLAGGCLAMDTKIPLLDGRTLNIREIEQELKSDKKIWIYSTNPKTGHITPGLVTWAGVTNERAKVCKLTFDNGKELICTLDHKFPILGKGFVEAKDLQIGESMIPFNTKNSKLGNAEFEMIYQNDTNTWEYTHKMVGDYFKNINQHEEIVYSEKYIGEDKNVIHHKNFDRSNNDPSNLAFVNVVDHLEYNNNKEYLHQFRKEYQFFNHRLVNIEYLSEEIQVGTLTIDNSETYHDYHTFALDCGVFTKNSNLGELEDLMYFVKKLYQSLKVPTTRLDPQDAFRDGADMLREELKFARFIIRLQQMFAGSVKNSFITHLQMRGLWKEYELNDQVIDVEFNVPTNFYEMRESQRLEMKVSNYGSMATAEGISPTYAQKKYLGWDDIDVKANREFLRKDKEFKWEITQIENMGPNWKEAMEAQAEGAEAAGGGAEAGGAGGGGGGAGPGGAPPPFPGGAGGAPEAGGEAGGGEEAAAPEAPAGGEAEPAA